MGEVNKTRKRKMSIVRQILPRFPLDHVRCAFGYGSAVFPQRGNQGADRQIDMIVITDSLVDFHRANMIHNKDDYSQFMKNKSPESLAQWNSKATGLYFNQFVKIDQGELKYGVISTENLVNDLVNWEHLYISGRLHKPVKLVTPSKTGLDLAESRPDSDLELSTALETNLMSAVRVASLLEPGEKTNFDQLVMNICNLSYLGDIRQKGFEDTQKVAKIVEGSYENLKTLYLPIIDKCDWLESSSGGDIYKSTAPADLINQINNLPSRLQQANLASAVSSGELKSGLEGEIASIVSTSSKAQTWVNFWTAGPIRSTKYGLAKVKKFTKSLSK